MFVYFVYLYFFFLKTQKIRGADLNKRYQKAWLAAQREVLSNSVSLFRKYRVGDLPDICIPKSEIQLPLQALHTDPTIAKQIFLIFFEAIYNEAKQRSDRNNKEYEAIQDGLINAIKNCHSNGSVVSALLLAATKVDHLDLHPKYVADLAIRFVFLPLYIYIYVSFAGVFCCAKTYETVFWGVIFWQILASFVTFVGFAL